MSEKSIFVGYVNIVKIYRIWYPETNKIKASRKIIFRNEITVKEISINENGSEEINNLSEITMKLA